MVASSEVVKRVGEAVPSLLSLLEKSVNINSWSKNAAGIRQVQDLFESELKALGLAVSREVFPSGDVLVGRTKSSAKNDSLLVGHADTVYPPSSSFQKFSIEGDFARGPGVLDMKGGLVAVIGALRVLRELGDLDQIPLTFFINHDEETGSIESRPLLLEVCRNVSAALIFEPGRKGNGIVTRRKGVGNFKIEVQGKTAHSGNQHSAGINAIEELAHKITALQALTDYEKGITLNVGLVSGGTAVNTVPGHASAEFDLRVESMASYREIRDKLTQIENAPSVVAGAKTRILEEYFEGPMEQTEKSLALFDQYRKAAAEFGFEIALFNEIVGGGSDGNGTSSAGIPTIDGLGPFGEFFHTDKEYLLISSFTPKISNLVCYLNAFVRR